MEGKMEATSREKFFRNSSVFLIFLILLMILLLFFRKERKLNREVELQQQSGEVLATQKEVLEETRNLLIEISNLVTIASRPPRMETETNNERER